jgi:hypothetical protein
MKVRITTLLSLTGVLVAGSAAALVNTQVLSSTALRKSTASEISVADSQSPASGTVGTEVANKFAPLAPNLAPLAAQTTFDVSPAGTVVLDATGGVLSIVSVTPSGADWTVAGSEAEEGQVEVKFQSATQLVEFKASLVAGQIVTSVETTDLTTTSVGGTTHTSVSGHDSDDQNETHHSGQTGGKTGSHEQSGGGGEDD